MSTDDFDSETFEEALTSPEVASKPLWMQHAGWLVLGLIFIVYMVIIPSIGLVIEWMTPVRSRELTDMTFAETMRLHTVAGVIMFMFLSMGASVGSFLNVFIYRLPRRLPLLWPPSACTRCKTRLSLSDNLPVIGWLRLGGKCGHCGVSVSARYPIVESIAAILIITLYYRELLSGGANLPVRITPYYTGVVWILFYTKWDLLFIYLFHCFVLMLLLGWGLINFDRFRVPLLNGIICCLVVVGLTSVFPILNPTNKSWAATISFMPASAFVSCAGCLIGTSLGLVADFLLPIRHIEQSTQNPSTDEEPAVQPGEGGVVEGDESEVALLETRSSESAEIHSKPLHEIYMPPEGNETSLSSVTTTGDLSAEASEEHDDSIETTAAESYGTPAADPAKSGNAAFCLALVGATFGIEAVAFAAAGTLVLSCVVALLSRVFTRNWIARLTPALSVFASAVVVLLFWDSVYDLFWKLTGR